MSGMRYLEHRFYAVRVKGAKKGVLIFGPTSNLELALAFQPTEPSELVTFLGKQTPEVCYTWDEYKRLWSELSVDKLNI